MSLRAVLSDGRRSHEHGYGRDRKAGNRSVRGPLTLEQLEGRQVLAAFIASETYLVSTLGDSGPGSLRVAIIAANAHKGADAIDFSVVGTISLKSALPAVTESLKLNGASAPGYAGKPVVTLDFQNNPGLVISANADGSVIQSLALVDSSGAGISLSASAVTVAGNYIGLRANGVTIEGNRGDGVAILAGSHDNMIGNGDSTSSFQLSNVISGNRGNGVSITGANATNNDVAMNYIGTDVTGMRNRGNGGNGVVITGGASNNFIGGEATGGNDPKNGVLITSTNRGFQNNDTIGGKRNDRYAYSNAIAFNGDDGILIAGASGVSVVNNMVKANAGGGVTLLGAENTQIGVSGKNNSIVRNGTWGVYASGSLTNSSVQDNVIRGNRGSGVVLRAAQGLLVGGTANDSGNTITRNKAFGLLATGNCSGSKVEGNTIKHNAAGNRNVARSSGLVLVDYSLILGENESVTGVRGARGKKVILVGSYLPDNELRNPVMGQWWVGDLSTGVGQKVRVIPTFSGQTVTTSVYYGPNTDAFNPALGKNNIRVVGTYEYSQNGTPVSGEHGVLYQGPANGVGGTWTQINVPDSLAGGTVTNTIPHSTMGNLVVGNYSVEGQPVGAASAFIYEISTGTYQLFDSSWDGFTDLTSAYGIWQNGGPSSTFYTIVGGQVHEGANTAYMVNYDSATRTFSNKAFFPLGVGLAGDTHFEGINAAPGGYTLSATILSGGTTSAAYAYVPVSSDGSFGTAQWVPLNYPGSSFCSGDTVYQNVEIGICILPNPDPISPRYIERTYKATVTVTGGRAGSGFDPRPSHNVVALGGGMEGKGRVGDT
jgi:hypothetical protein